MDYSLETMSASHRQPVIDTFLAAISSENEEPLGFHLKNGFREAGRFARIGRKFGEDFDVVWLQKHLGRSG